MLGGGRGRYQSNGCWSLLVWGGGNEVGLEEPCTGGGPLVGSVLGRCGSWRRERGVGCEFGGGKRLEVVAGHQIGGAPGYRG